MTDLEAIAKDAAERVHKNGGCVPQMAFAPILFALQDAFPAPVASGGQHSSGTDFPPDDVLACVESQHSSGEGLDAVEPLRRSIADLKRHIDAVQAAKRNRGPGDTITDCINDLPAIVRALEASEFEIEAAFEAYEDASPVPAQDDDKLRIAVEALGPFADFVTPAPKWMKDVDVVSAGSPLARKQLTFGDCRRAAEALAALKPEGK